MERIRQDSLYWQASEDSVLSRFHFTSHVPALMIPLPSSVICNNCLLVTPNHFEHR